MTLEELFQMIEQGWPCTLKEYQSYPANGSKDEQDAFVLKHVASHLNMSLGRVGEVIEIVDHGEAVDKELLKNIPKQLILAAIKIALLIQTEPAQLEAEFRAWQAKHAVAK